MSEAQARKAVRDLSQDFGRRLCRRGMPGRVRPALLFRPLGLAVIAALATLIARPIYACGPPDPPDPPHYNYTPDTPPTLRILYNGNEVVEPISLVYGEGGYNFQASGDADSDTEQLVDSNNNILSSQSISGGSWSCSGDISYRYPDGSPAEGGPTGPGTWIVVGTYHDGDGFDGQAPATGTTTDSGPVEATVTLYLTEPLPPIVTYSPGTSPEFHILYGGEYAEGDYIRTTLDDYLGFSLSANPTSDTDIKYYWDPYDPDTPIDDPDEISGGNWPGNGVLVFKQSTEGEEHSAPDEPGFWIVIARWRDDGEEKATSSEYGTTIDNGGSYYEMSASLWLEAPATVSLSSSKEEGEWWENDVYVGRTVTVTVTDSGDDYSSGNSLTWSPEDSTGQHATQAVFNFPWDQVGVKQECLFTLIKTSTSGYGSKSGSINVCITATGKDQHNCSTCDCSGDTGGTTQSNAGAPAGQGFLPGAPVVPGAGGSGGILGGSGMNLLPRYNSSSTPAPRGTLTTPLPAIANRWTMPPFTDRFYKVLATPTVVALYGEETYPTVNYTVDVTKRPSGDTFTIESVRISTPPEPGDGTLWLAGSQRQPVAYKPTNTGRYQPPDGSYDAIWVADGKIYRSVAPGRTFVYQAVALGSVNSGALIEIHDGRQFLTVSRDVLGRISGLRDMSTNPSTLISEWTYDQTTGRLEAIDDPRAQAGDLTHRMEFVYGLQSPHPLVGIRVNGRYTAYNYAQGGSSAPLLDVITGTLDPDSAERGNTQPPEVVRYGDTGRALGKIVSRYRGTTSGGTFVTGIEHTYAYYGSENPEVFQPATGNSAQSSAWWMIREQIVTYHQGQASQAIQVSDTYVNRFGLELEKRLPDSRVIPAPVRDMEGRILEQTSPDGLTKTTRTYMSTIIDETVGLGLGRAFQGKVATSSRTGCSSCGGGGGGAAISVTYTYDPFGNVRTETDAGGRVTRHFYDYQEAPYADTRVRLAQTFFVTDSPSSDQLTAVDQLVTALGMNITTNAADRDFGLGDLNGDGVTNQADGLMLRTDLPAVTVHVAGGQPVQQRRIRIYRHDASGNVTHQWNEEGTLTRSAYNATGQVTERIDDAAWGDSQNPQTPLFTSAGGTAWAYSLCLADRDNGTNPPFVQALTNYVYDSRGNRTQETNPRGVVTTYTYSDRNVPIQAVHAASISAPRTSSMAPGVTFPVQAEPTTGNSPQLAALSQETIVRSDVDGSAATWPQDNTHPGVTLNSGNGFSGTFVTDAQGIAGCGDYAESYTETDRYGRTIAQYAETSQGVFEVTRTYYDVAGHVVLVVHPDGTADFTGYDLALNRVTTTVRGLNSFSALTADELATIVGRPASLSTSLSGSPARLNYVYDALGHARGAVRTDQSEDDAPLIGYDSLGRVVYNQDLHTRTTQLTAYDSLGRVTNRTVTGIVGDFTDPQATTTTLSRTNYVYDEADRVVQTNRWVAVPTGVTLARAATAPVGDTGPLDDLKPSGATATDWISDRVTYDRLGRTVARQCNPSPAAPVVWLPSGSAVTLSRTQYDGLGRTIKTADALADANGAGGNTMETWYDAAGNAVETQRVDVATTLGLTGQPVAQTFLETRFYDALDRAVLQVDSAGAATDMVYDSLGRLAARTDARGANATARTLPRRRPGANPATVACNDFGNVTQTLYDAQGRRIREDRVLTASGTGDGAHIGILPPDRDYDATNADQANAPYTAPASDATQGGGDGRITVRYEYDAAGRLAALIDDNGNKTSWQYDSQGRKTAETKGQHVAPLGQNANAADVLTDPTTIQWTFNATTGLVDSMTREDGSQIAYTFDSLDAGRLVAVAVTGGANATPPLAGTTAQTFVYDGLGHRIASTDNNDPAANTDDADCTWVYDSLGRMIEESQTLGQGGTPAVVSYKHQANDRAALVYPNGRTTGFTAHYPGGPLHAIADLDANGDPVAGRAIAAYDYLGGRTLVRSMQNAVSLDLREDAGGASFDPSGRPTKWLHRDTQQQGSPTKIGFEYAYDGNGNKLYQKSVHDPLDGQRYAYDSADRLVAMKRGAFSTNPYSYSAAPTAATWSDLDAYQGWALDGLGNWSQYVTQRGNQAAATETRTDDTFNAYAVAGADENGQGGTAQTHDPNGNLTNDGKKVLKWDAMNRLREVWTTTGTLVATYSYDTVGRRLRKVVGAGFPGESAVFRFADWRILEDCSTGEAPVPHRQYTYGNYLDEVLTMDTDQTANGVCTDFGPNGSPSPDTRIFYHQSSLFSVYAITDYLGNAVEAYEYDPYGKHTAILDGPDSDTVVGFYGTDIHALMAASPHGNPCMFTGQRFDSETGLCYFRFRMYSVESGSFISRDLLPSDDFQSLYEYVGAPNATDPMGLYPVDAGAGEALNAIVGLLKEPGEMVARGINTVMMAVVERLRYSESVSYRQQLGTWKYFDFWFQAKGIGSLKGMGHGGDCCVRATVMVSVEVVAKTPEVIPLGPLGTAGLRAVFSAYGQGYYENCRDKGPGLSGDAGFQLQVALYKEASGAGVKIRGELGGFINESWKIDHGHLKRNKISGGAYARFLFDMFNGRLRKDWVAALVFGDHGGAPIVE